MYQALDQVRGSENIESVLNVSKEKFEEFFELTVQYQKKVEAEKEKWKEEQAEDFFKKIQDVEDELAKVNAQVELKEMVEASKD